MEGVASLIEDWLHDCEDSSDEVIVTLIESDEDRLIHAFTLLFDEKARYPHLFERAVNQLFVLARSKNDHLRNFVLILAPLLLYIFLSSNCMGDKKGVDCVEVTLLTLYNVEVLDELGHTRMAPFRLPSLARYSIYHDPSSLAPTSFTPESLQRLETGDEDLVSRGGLGQMSSLSASNRNILATAIIACFNSKVATFPKIALKHLCKSTSKIVCQGFNRPGHQHRTSYGSESNFPVYPRPVPRIPVTSDLLMELLHSVYFAIFNEYTTIGIQTLEDIHVRAQYEFFTDVLLMSTAIKHSLQTSANGQSSVAPMGINIALTPAADACHLSKSIITNASFRTKKLPDDIPIQKHDNTQDKPALSSICEDADGEEKDGTASKQVPRIALGLGREKENKVKFVPGGIPLASLVKRKDKEKSVRNGDSRRDSERKQEKKERTKIEKVNGAGNNRSSAIYEQDSASIPLIEMKAISSSGSQGGSDSGVEPSDREDVSLCDLKDVSLKIQESIDSVNHVTKVSIN